ncbi:MAG: phytoene/squalene synthase family protein [Ignavibacteriae bacterium]|nr:phytoene/squalene synthase family protein [Ignavibacteriota bacterium]MCB9214839.1 phytoene/squalene synthase family protein [Ignavibacteria bacterium]
MEPEIELAYDYCRSVTATHARTFYFASLFLNRQKRAACYAVYAFCRYVDDLADEHGEPDNPMANIAMERALSQWRNDLESVYSGEKKKEPVMLAWADVLNRYDIPKELPELLIEGCMSDIRSTVRFETFDELYGYCYKVASVVGLMTSRIFGYRDQDADSRAVDLGIAMQLTNILRDIGEDVAMNRVYLPQEELEEFGLENWDLVEGRITPEFRRFMSFQIDRARQYYSSANSGIPMLEPDSQLTVQLMSHNYAAILGAIEQNDYDVFSRRAFVPLHRKLLSVPRLWLQGKKQSP